MAVKIGQILQIEPQHELKFRGPFTSPVTSYMKLKNPSDKIIGFKIKTTAPKRYCVRPNCGVLKPEESVEIAVSLQPFDFDPAEKNKHKFMVQSVVMTDPDVDWEAMWRQVPNDYVMDSKLRCIFELPEEHATTQLSETEQKKKTNVVDASSNPELLSAAKEIRELRENVSSLRQENLQLKEELMKQRQIAASVLAKDHEPRIITETKEGQLPQWMYAALAMLVILLAVLMGKYVA